MPILTTEERVGTLLAGKYSLQRVIGEGGMGVVFEALHTWTNRQVAVKLLHPGHALDSDIARRFLQEARTAAAVRHPHIVDVLDMGSEGDGTVYLVLELLDGESLSKVIQRGPLDVERALAIMLPAMGAIATAHDKGIIHRDLKPENFFIHREGDEVITKVLDFGLAKALDAGSHQQTRQGLVLGTPFYVAPEQAAGEPDIGPPVDVWAMAVVMYECLSGRVPFTGDTPTAVILKVCTGEPVPLDQVAPHLPPTIVSVVHQALTKEPLLRYPDMRAFGSAMMSAAQVAGIHVVTPRGLGENSAPPMRRKLIDKTLVDDDEDPTTSSELMPGFDSVDDPETIADPARPAELAESGPIARPAKKGPPMLVILAAAIVLFLLLGVGLGALIALATGDEPSEASEPEPSASSPAP